MTVVASYGMVLCGNSDDLQHRYRGRIEKVKFGVPIHEAFAHDIPATLLVLLLKVNKEGPLKKDIWRAPGNQAQVRKLSHIMQHGRLVNIANFSVYTAASVIKKFLSKLPGGIFGIENEQILFNSSINNTDSDKQRQVFFRIFCSLPVPSQHLLVLLFGTFRQVADSADSFGTRMNPDAIAISVAPSLFHSCIHDGRQVKVEDVQRFKLASQVVSQIITSFGHTNLFPRECYEFYARITGRTLRVDENWLFSFQYPSRIFSNQPEVVVSSTGSQPGPSSNLPPAMVSRLNNRLSSSVGEVLHESIDVDDHLEMEALRPLTACAGETGRSLSCLDWVHENQARRMKSRSDWFLMPVLPKRDGSRSVDFQMFGKNSAAAMDLQHLRENQHKLASEPLLEEKSSPETDRKAPDERKDRPPLGERQNSQKEIVSRQGSRGSIHSSVVSAAPPVGGGVAGWSPTSQSHPTSQTVSVTRRRSWRMRAMKELQEGTKTHSLDSPVPAASSADSTAHAHSISGEKWTAEMATEGVPKKRRSVKKKQSSQF